MSHQIFERNWRRSGLPDGTPGPVSYFLLTQILMREMPFSCQTRKHSALCERPSGRTQCSSHIAYNVNSLGVEAVRRQLPVLSHTNLGTVSGLRRDHPLNLSISLSGGKETN